MILAAQFATTPAGFITGLATPFLLVAVGWFGKRFAARLDKQDAAMAQQTTALAVLITEHTATAQKAVAAAATATELDRAVAVLQSRLDEHERWSQTEYERVVNLAARRGAQDRPAPV